MRSILSVKALSLLLLTTGAQISLHQIALPSESAARRKLRNQGRRIRAASSIEADAFEPVHQFHCSKVHSQLASLLARGRGV